VSKKSRIEAIVSDEAIEQRIKAAEKDFKAESSIGDTSYFYSAWSSWLIRPDKEIVVPVVRVILGDSQGNVVFKRSVVLTGILFLIVQLAETLLTELHRAKGLKGMTLDLPGNNDSFVKLITRAESALTKSKDVINELIIEDVNYERPKKVTKPKSSKGA
jgi:hypothetical protein